MPYKIETDPDKVKVDPYGPNSPDYQADDNFAHMWCSGLAHCQKRFSGQTERYKKEPSGGMGAFTPDGFPVFDVFRQNCWRRQSGANPYLRAIPCYNREKQGN